MDAWRRQLRLGGLATDLDLFVEIEFEDSGRTAPKQVVGGKSGRSAEEGIGSAFGHGVYLGRWRPDAKLKPEQSMPVAVKVMASVPHQNHDGAFSCP